MHTDSVQIQVEMDRADIAFLVGLMESYSNFAVVRTLDQHRGLVELMCSPDYVAEVHKLLDSLRDEMPLRILTEDKG